MAKYYLQLTDGTVLPETEDLLGLFSKARSMNEGQLTPRTFAIFRVEDPPVCLATFGAFKLSTKPRRRKPVEETQSESSEEDVDEEA